MASKGWFPGRQEEQLAMAKTWKNVLAAKAAAWGIPAAQAASLDAAITGVEQAQAICLATPTPANKATVKWRLPRSRKS